MARGSERFSAASFRKISTLARQPGIKELLGGSKGAFASCGDGEELHLPQVRYWQRVISIYPLASLCIIQMRPICRTPVSPGLRGTSPT